MDAANETTTELMPADAAEGVDAATLDRVVGELTALQRRAGLEMARAVGALIIDGLYGGELGAWRMRGNKDASFRKLAARGDLPMRPGTIYQAVAIYELTERLGLRSLRTVGVSHLRLLLGLPERQQVRLLERAESQGLTVAQLEAEVRKQRRELPGVGRPPLPRFRRTLNALTRALGDDAHADEALGDLDAVERLDDAEIAEIQQALDHVRRQVDKIATALARRTAPATDAASADV